MRVFCNFAKNWLLDGPFGFFFRDFDVEIRPAISRVTGAGCNLVFSVAVEFDFCLVKSSSVRG
jgi:hypothetical protein